MRGPRVRIWVLVAAAVCVSGAHGGQVTLVDDGVARCCVVVGPEGAFSERPQANWASKVPFLAWAAADVATYLGRMSGAAVRIAERPVEGLIPIYVGCAPEAAPLNRSTEFGDAYVVEVSDQRVVLHGESRRAVYYAAADLLHRLGVRWYAPGELGEVVPERKTIAVNVGRTESEPDFVTRRIWCRPPHEQRWMYRNRLGDATIPCGHSVHAYAALLPGWKGGREARAQHPEYYNVIDGQCGGWINLANPEVARLFAAKAIELLRQERRGAQGGKFAKGFVSISPDDGYLRDERPEVVAMNSAEPDPVLRMASFSDAWFAFLNRVCAEVHKEAPDLEFRFGSLAYMNYMMPPKKSKPDPRIVPVIAPITFNRYVSMGTPGAPTSELLEEVVKGWVAISPRVGVYLYNFNLSDMAMPYTRRVHWTNGIPKLFRMGVKDFIAESHPNWHTMLPGNYVAARLLWDTETDVAALLDEFYPEYYGAASEWMRHYDSTLEKAYETTRVFAGGTWGMHGILTPDVMRELDRALSESEEKVRGKGIYEQRVEVVRYSLNFAKLWFDAREALNRFDLAEAEKQGAAFIANYKAAYEKYPLFFGPNHAWSPNIERYFELFHNRCFKDAGRIAREGTVVYRFPDEWLVHLEPVEGGARPSGRMPDAEKDQWRPLKTFSATLDEQGLTFFRGVLWYRNEFALSPEHHGAKTFRLWFGGVDSRVRVWLNGQEVGEKFAGSFSPVEFDISGFVKPDGRNVMVVAVDNMFPNEIGTGGIVRPVLIYVPIKRDVRTPGAPV